MPAESRLQPPFRRVLAVDVGSRALRLALVESSFRRIRVLAEQSLDLQEEGLVAPEEFNAQLQAICDRLGRPPIALTLPQHLSTSQLLDLPSGPDTTVNALIEAEVAKLSGVSETTFIYDFIRLKSQNRQRQQFWVTLCQERELRDQIRRLGLEQQDLCDVTTTANALLAAFGATCPETQDAILIHAGAQNTVMVILLGGQGVFATSFATGGDYFTRAIAAEKECPLTEAETLKRTRNLLQGPDALQDLPAKVDTWLSQLTHQLNDWFETAPAPSRKLSDFRIVASGTALDQPGLLDYLQTRSGLAVERWPITGVTTTDHPDRGFEVAFGTALQALRRTPQQVSLLPPDIRAAWKKRLDRQWIDCASYALLIVIFLVLVLGTWQKWRTWQYKQALQAQAQQSLQDLRTTQLATARLITEYEAWRPLLARQKMTLDTLKTLDLLEHTRSNRNFWYVLFADQSTYFTRPLPPPPPPATTTTNAAAATTNAPTLATGITTNNPIPAKPGFIAELCIAEDADAARRTFGQLVSELKKKPLFSKVDSLSSDLRRNLADPHVLLPARHFVLEIELAGTEFLEPAPRPSRSGRPTNLAPRSRPLAAPPANPSRSKP